MRLRHGRNLIRRLEKLLRLSAHFRALMADEQRGSDFRLFTLREDALAWLGGT